MKRYLLGVIYLFLLPSISAAKELPKAAVWDLAPREVKESYARELTSILASEVTKLGKYEVNTQEHVRALAGWTEERIKLGCTNAQCLTALGQIPGEDLDMNS